MRTAHIEFSTEGLTVDGMTLDYKRIAELLYDMAHPDPRKWCRFERVGDVCIVHYVITTKEAPDGSSSCGSANLSGQGQEAPRPRDESFPN